jgi:hypothetical protein
MDGSLIMKGLPSRRVWMVDPPLMIALKMGCALCHAPCRLEQRGVLPYPQSESGGAEEVNIENDMRRDEGGEVEE